MSMTALVAKLLAVLAAGFAADRGMPVCVAGAINALIGIGLNFVCGRVVADYTRGSGIIPAKPWVMQVVLLGWTGFALALLPTVGINMFPPEVRASGYNLGYSITSGFVGGLSPFAITAIRTSEADVTRDYGAALWTLAAGTVSAAAYLVTLWLKPACNTAAAQPLSATMLRTPSRRVSSSSGAGMAVAAAAAIAAAGAK